MSRREYAFATTALRESRSIGLFKTVTGLVCIAMAVLGAIAQFHPTGPHDTLPRILQATTEVSGILVGLRWLFGRWPRHLVAVAFAVWADAALALAAVTMSTPEARLLATLYLGVVGVYVAFLLGRYAVALHCTFCAGLIVGVLVWAVRYDDASAFGLYIYVVPTLTWTLVLPLSGLALIEAGRRAIRRTARSAHRDQLTGLHNRRGLRAGVNAALAQRGTPGTLVAAVCDIDRFKELNDVHGHLVGDAALVALADQMKLLARPGDVTARIGGDELVLAAVVNGPDDVAELVDRIWPLTRVEVGDSVLTASVGTATMPTDHPHFSLDDVLRAADAAMYRAKRAGGGARHTAAHRHV